MEEDDGSGHGVIVDTSQPPSAPAVASRAMPAGPRWWRAGLVLVVGVAIAARVAFAVVLAPDLPTPGDATLYRGTAQHLADGDGFVYPAPGGGPPSRRPSTRRSSRSCSPASTWWVWTRCAITGSPWPCSPGRGSRWSRSSADGGGPGGRAHGGVPRRRPPHVDAVRRAGAQRERVPRRRCPSCCSPRSTCADGGARPTVRRRGEPAVPGCIGAAGLTRPKVSACWPWWRRRPCCSGRSAPLAAWRTLGLVALVTVLTVAPWIVRNRIDLDAWVLSTNGGKTLLGSNCAETYAGPALGGFSYDLPVRGGGVPGGAGPAGGGVVGQQGVRRRARRGRPSVHRRPPAGRAQGGRRRGSPACGGWPSPRTSAASTARRGGTLASSTSASGSTSWCWPPRWWDRSACSPPGRSGPRRSCSSDRSCWSRPPAWSSTAGPGCAPARSPPSPSWPRWPVASIAGARTAAAVA